jgi:hypothetical protein
MAVVIDEKQCFVTVENPGGSSGPFSSKSSGIASFAGHVVHPPVYPMTMAWVMRRRPDIAFRRST